MEKRLIAKVSNTEVFKPVLLLWLPSADLKCLVAIMITISSDREKVTLPLQLRSSELFIKIQKKNETSGVILSPPREENFFNLLFLRVTRIAKRR